MNGNKDKPWLEEVPAEQDPEAAPRKPRPHLVWAGVVVIVAFLGLLIFVYQSDKDGQPGEVPTVRAPEDPVRVKPEDPGGAEIAHRDKLVYNRVTGTEEETGAMLGAGPELPQEMPRNEAEEPQPPESQTGEPQPAESGEKAAPEPSGEAAPASGPEAEPEAESATTPETTPETTSAPTPAAADGDFMIQLGAFGSRASAEGAWDTLKDRHGAVLQGLAPDYEALDRPGATLYRLRAGGFADRAGAEAVCDKLKERGQDCFPAAR